MVTKLTAARIATSAGVRTVITHGQKPSNIIKILQGEAIGTHFEAQKVTENARKRWIAYGLLPMGKLYLDDGAIKAICEKGKSLLPAGISKIEGKFTASESVILCDQKGQEIARGIVNYSSSEIDQIKGQKSENINSILGYMDSETVIHRDNLVILYQDS
jgi:glutamate 5-kinase